MQQDQNSLMIQVAMLDNINNGMAGQLFMDLLLQASRMHSIQIRFERYPSCGCKYRYNGYTVHHFHFIQGLIPQLLNVLAAFTALTCAAEGIAQPFHAGNTILNRGPDLSVCDCFADAYIHCIDISGYSCRFDYLLQAPI